MNLRMLKTLPRPTRAAAIALLFFGCGRIFFFVYPDAFTAYPETQAEFAFYRVDLQCKAKRPQAQIIVQGTSRLETLHSVPLLPKRWHTQDKMANLSQPLNTFWHMNLLHRRNPGLLEQAELWIIDVLPVQARVSFGFNEHDSLFLRESTFREKILVRDPFDRIRALADWVVPFNSNSHGVRHWMKALSTLHVSADKLLDTILKTDYKLLPNIVGVRSDVPQPGKVFANVLYPPKSTVSKIQLQAFRELLNRAPASAHLLFIHPPYHNDFARIIGETPGMTEVKDETRRFIESAAADRVHVEWYEAPEDIGITPADFAPDGVHASPTGMEQLGKHFAQAYRKWIPLRDNPAAGLESSLE